MTEAFDCQASNRSCLAQVCTICIRATIYVEVSCVGLHVNDFSVALWIVSVPSVPLGVKVTKINVLHFLIGSNVLAGPFGSLVAWSLHAVLGLV